MTARTILARKGRRVEKASPNLPTLDAARTLRDKRIGCLVICDERGRVIGVLDEQDIAAGLVKHCDAIFTFAGGGAHANRTDPLRAQEVAHPRLAPEPASHVRRPDDRELSVLSPRLGQRRFGVDCLEVLGAVLERQGESIRRGTCRRGIVVESPDEGN